jgi:hypothetical protein
MVEEAIGQVKGFKELKESITLVLKSQSCGQYPDSNTYARFLNASLSRFILIINAS